MGLLQSIRQAFSEETPYEFSSRELEQMESDKARVIERHPECAVLWETRIDKQYASIMAPQWLRIVKDSVALVNKTKSPDVFFKRYDLIIDYLICLSKLETVISFTPRNPSEDLKRIRDQRIEQTDIFIRRAYENTMEAVSKLKTPKGRANKIDTFFVAFEPYMKMMDKQNIDTLQQLKDQMLPVYAGFETL